MEEKGKTKLKKLRLTSVDMVRRGANPDAYINLYKSAEEPPEPSPEEAIEKGMAAKILDAVKAALGMSDVEKKADTFNEKVAERAIDENRWKYQDALNMSIDSILHDKDLDTAQKKAKAAESIDQFAEAYKAMCNQLMERSEGPAEPAELAKADDEEIVEEPSESEPEGQEGDQEGEPNDPNEDTKEKEEEGDREMKIDKSKFTAEELEQYEALIAKGMVEEETDPEPAVQKSEGAMDENVQKAFNDAMAEMAELKKNMEMAELTNVAKKYTVLGKKEDELAGILYEMKKSSEKSYNDYIALLDESVAMVEKGGMFEEIGKSSRSIPGGSATGKIESIATEIQKADPSLSRVVAINKAWEQHPELVAEYENEYRK